VSGTYLTSLADWLRAAGCNVTEYSGWQTRARSSGGYASGRPWGVMWHHTASQTSPQNDASYMCNGSSDRPIANLLIARDGSVWVLAAGCTNTNGKGNGWKWSRGTVPADSMNSYAIGMEIANSGVGEAYPQVQIDAAFAASVAIVKALGLDAGDVCQHYNYAPGRKIDPARATAVQGPWKPGSCTSSGTWELNDLVAEHRRRCGAAPAPGPTPPGPTPTPPTPGPTPTGDDDDMASAILQASDDRTGPYFWWDGRKIGAVRSTTQVDVGRVVGVYSNPSSTPLTNFTKAQLRDMIASGWDDKLAPPAGYA
jgi:hypothetical protein